MTDHDKENMSSTQALQVREMLQKSGQLPTPTPSRESSRTGARQKAGEFQAPQQSAAADQSQQCDQTLQAYQRPQTPQAQREEQQPSEVKRKRGRPRKRPLSPSSKYPHVKVRVVPTPTQAEYQRQQQQKQSRARSQASATATVGVAVPVWQNAQTPTDLKGANSSGTLPAPTLTGINGLVSGAQATSHPPDVQYPPDVSSNRPLLQPPNQRPPPHDPFPGWSASQAQHAPAQPIPQQVQDGALTMSQMFDEITNIQQEQAPTVQNPGVLQGAIKDIGVTGEAGRKRRPRPSLKVRENAAHSGSGGAGGEAASQIQQSETADNNEAVPANPKPAPKNNTTKAAKAKDKSKGRARANNTATISGHPGSTPRENPFITDTSLLHHNNTHSQPQLRSDALMSNSQVLSQPPRHARVQGQHHPPSKAELPWHVTRWHALGFMTFSIGHIDSDTGEQEYRVVLRNGKINNTLAFWYNHAMGGIALKYGAKRGEEEGEVLFDSIPEVAKAMVDARKEYMPSTVSGVAIVGVPGDEPAGTMAANKTDAELAQRAGWDFLLEDVKYEAKAWKEQRRSKWDELKWVRKEVRSRRLSRGDFVAVEDEDCGARSDVAMADGDEGDNVLGLQVGLGYHRVSSGIGGHWMERQDIQNVVQRGQVWRSRVAQVEMQDGKKTKYTMVYSPMQDPRHSEFEKGVDDLEERLKGLRNCRKGKLQNVLEQVERGSFSLKHAAKDRVGGEQVQALTAPV